MSSMLVPFFAASSCPAQVVQPATFVALALRRFVPPSACGARARRGRILSGRVLSAASHFVNRLLSSATSLRSAVI